MPKVTRVKRSRRRGGDIEAVKGTPEWDAIQVAINKLPIPIRDTFYKDVNKLDIASIFGSGPGKYSYWADQQRAQGKEPNIDEYRWLRLQATIRASADAEKYQSSHSGFLGFIKGAAESFAHAAPQGAADALNVIGRVLPGASHVTDKLEGILNPNGDPHSWEQLGGPTEMVVNGATNLAARAGGRVRKGQGAGKKRKDRDEYIDQLDAEVKQRKRIRSAMRRREVRELDNNPMSRQQGREAYTPLPVPSSKELMRLRALPPIPPPENQFTLPPGFRFGSSVMRPNRKLYGLSMKSYS